MRLRRFYFPAFLLLFLFGSLEAQHKKNPEPKQRGPYSFGEIIEMLESNMDVIKSVNTHKLSFKSMTPEMAAILRQFGASDALMSLLPKLPPPPAVSGDLNIHCEPVDCFVEIGENAFGRSENGVKTIRGLLPGDRSVRITADGFESIMQPIKLQAGAPQPVSFSLKRTADQTKYRVEDLFFRAIQAAGGLDALAELQGKRFEGTILPYGPGKGMWNLVVQPTGGNYLVTVSSDTGYCTETFPATKLNPDCSRKGAPPVALLSLTYEMYRDAMLPTIIARVMEDVPGNGVTVEETSNGFRFSGTAFNLRTDKDLLPVEATKPSDGGNVSFEDWFQSGSHKYPSRMVFNRNGANLEPLVSATLKVTAVPLPPKKGGRK